MIKNLDLYYSNIKKAVEANINNFELLKNSTLLVTGANGMIASCVVDTIYILNRDYNYGTKVIGLMFNKNQMLNRFNDYDFFEALEQDVTQTINYNEHIDYIIHAASFGDPKSFSKMPVDIMTSNFQGLKNVLDLAKNVNSKKVLYISSGEIYGQGDSTIESFKEDYLGDFTVLNPRSCYPVSKIASETLCCSYYGQYGIESVIARPCHTYGPTQSDKDSRAASSFIRNSVNGESIIMKSKGEQVRSYCNVLDNATGLLTILCNGDNCNAYNVANNNSIVSIKDFAEKLTKIANTNLVIEVPTEEEQNSYNPVTRSVLDGSKLQNIGWRPIFNIDDGLKMTIDIMK